MRIGSDIMINYSRRSIERVLYDEFNYGSSEGKVIEQLNQINKMYQEFKLESCMYDRQEVLFDIIFGSLERNIESKGEVQMNALSFMFFITFLYTIKVSNSRIINFSSRKILIDKNNGTDGFIDSFQENYEDVKELMETKFDLNFEFLLKEHGLMDENTNSPEVIGMIQFRQESIVECFLSSVYIEKYEDFSSEIEDLLEETKRIALYKAISLEDQEWIYKNLKSFNNRCLEHLKIKREK